MSHRLGSSINSPLFMEDPIPLRNRKNHNSTQSNDQSFFLKGNDDDIESKPKVEEDVFIINSQGGSFQLHRKTLKDTLLELKVFANTSVNQLDPPQLESFKSIVEALKLLYGSQAVYDIVLNDIRESFSDIKDVKPGTVAAFFIGCFTDDPKFPGPMGCSPKCAASLPPTEGTPGYGNCDDLVLIYKDGLFSSLNEKRSRHAYVYIGEPSFNGFTDENITQLSEAEIETVSLVFGNQDGTYREVTSPLLLEKLPRNSEKAPITKQVVPVQTSEMTSTTSSAAGIIFAIIIIGLIILLIVVIARGNYLQ